MPYCFINDLLVERLKHNLLSISQFCDKGNQVIFNATQYLVIKKVNKEVKLFGKGINNIYMINLDFETTLEALAC